MLAEAGERDQAGGRTAREPCAGPRFGSVITPGRSGRCSVDEGDDSDSSVHRDQSTVGNASRRVTGSDNRRDAVLTGDDRRVRSKRAAIRDHGRSTGEQRSPRGGGCRGDENISRFERREFRWVGDDASGSGGDPGARGLADDGVGRDGAAPPGSFHRATDRVADELRRCTDRERRRLPKLLLPERSSSVGDVSERTMTSEFGAVEEEHLLGG